MCVVRSICQRWSHRRKVYGSLAAVPLMMDSSDRQPSTFACRSAHPSAGRSPSQGDRGAHGTSLRTARRTALVSSYYDGNRMLSLALPELEPPPLSRPPRRLASPLLFFSLVGVAVGCSGAPHPCTAATLLHGCCRGAWSHQQCEPDREASSSSRQHPTPSSPRSTDGCPNGEDSDDSRRPWLEEGGGCGGGNHRHHPVPLSSVCCGMVCAMMCIVVVAGFLGQP